MDLYLQMSERMDREWKACRNRLLVVWGVVGLVNFGVILTALTW